MWRGIIRSLAQALAAAGLPAWKKNIGVKIPVLPPLASATAPLWRNVDTAVEPLGAKPAVSSRFTVLFVSQRPGAVWGNPEMEKRPDRGSHHGISVSAVSAMSRA